MALLGAGHAGEVIHRERHGFRNLSLDISASAPLPRAHASEDEDKVHRRRTAAARRLRCIVRQVIWQLRRRRGDGVVLKDIAARSRHLYEDSISQLPSEEADYLRDVLTANPLLFKATRAVSALVEASSSSFPGSPCLSTAVDALHKMKLYTARFLWVQRVRPLQERLEQLDRLYSQLKERFSATRTEYLKEVSEMRDAARPWRAGEDHAADIRFFYDPVTALGPEELSLLSLTLTEKLKMILEKDPTIQVNSSQLEVLLSKQEANEVIRLRNQVQQKDKEVADLKEKLQSLQELFAETAPGGLKALNQVTKQQNMVDYLERQVEELREELKVERGDKAMVNMARELKVATMELEDLRPAYKDAVDERISIQSRLEEVTGKLSKAEDIARGTSQQLSAVQAENRELQKQVKQLQAVRRAARVARQRSPITWPAFDDALPGEVAERDGQRKVEADTGIGDDAEDCEASVKSRLNAENVSLRIECDEVKEQLGSLRHSQAEHQAADACFEARRLRSVTKALSVCSSEGQEVQAGPATASAENLDIARMTVAERQEVLADLRERAESAAAQLEEGGSQTELEALRREGRELEATIFTQEVMLEAALWASDNHNTDRGRTEQLMSRVQAFCAQMLEKLMDSASANVVLVQRINDMQSRMKEAIKKMRQHRLQGMPEDAMDTGLAELEEVHQEDVFASSIFSQDSEVKRKAQEEILQQVVERLHKAAPSKRSLAKREQRVMESKAPYMAATKFAEDSEAVPPDSHEECSGPLLFPDVRRLSSSRGDCGVEVGDAGHDEDVRSHSLPTPMPPSPTQAQTHRSAKVPDHPPPPPPPPEGQRKSPGVPPSPRRASLQIDTEDAGFRRVVSDPGTSHASPRGPKTPHLPPCPHSEKDASSAHAHATDAAALPAIFLKPGSELVHRRHSSFLKPPAPPEERRRASLSPRLGVRAAPMTQSPKVYSDELSLLKVNAQKHLT